MSCGKEAMEQQSQPSMDEVMRRAFKDQQNALRVCV
jgi:hypothetical protein